MENNEISSLIVAFKEYRDLITPIESNLRDFSLAFEGMKTDIENLNKTFGGDIGGKLDKIYKELSGQADKSKSLVAEIDNFIAVTQKYAGQVDKLISLCSGIESKIGHVDAIQKRAEEQIEKLDSIIEQKKKTYDIKELQKNLEQYNVGVQKVNDYINKDVADALKNNNQKINEILYKNDNVFESIVEEKSSIDKLAESYQQSNTLLKKIVENNDVNEQYIFDILDKWAEDRKVKIKK